MMDEHKVTVRKDGLLDVLKRNHEQHVKEYQEAAEGYRLQLMGMLQGLLDKLHLGQDVSVMEAARLPKPENHGADYERVIRMLEMSVGSEATLSEDQFEQYVMDEWNWKSTHRAISSSYGSNR